MEPCSPRTGMFTEWGSHCCSQGITVTPRSSSGTEVTSPLWDFAAAFASGEVGQTTCSSGDKLYITSSPSTP